MRHRNVLVGLTVAVMLGPVSAGAAADADPDAARAFADLIEAYRAQPALTVKSVLEIELREGEHTARSHEVAAEFTYARRPKDDPNGAGIVRLNGFTCRFAGGEFFAVHDENEEAYYREEYEGSPYWALLINFKDIPYPHLAMLWGEASPEEVCMQLLPETPGIVPTKVETTTIDGKAMQRIELTGPNGALRLLVDPKTKLVREMEHEVTGGMTVQPGTRKITKYTCTFERGEKPLPAGDLAFDPGARELVDLIGALMPAPDPARGPGAPGGLIGEPAPAVLLATSDGGAVDLEDLRGQVVVLDFWATWCGPCRRALPLLHQVDTWAREQQLPVAVITINVWEVRDPAQDTPDNRLAQARAYWEKSGFTLPIAMDYTDETAMAYGVQGIPATFVIRSDGIVHAQHAGAGADYVALLKQEILDALEAIEAADPVED